MLRAYVLVAITCIINWPFYNEPTRTSNGHVRCRYVSKESSPNFQYQLKLSFNHTICEFIRIVSLYKIEINVKMDFDPFLMT